MGAFSRLFRRKSLDQLQSEASDETHGLKKALGPWELISLGIGAIVGAGIFATVGTGAAGEFDSAGNLVRQGAGPAVVLSFAVLAIVCTFCALCYAEMASMIPISGSAYTYAFATMGEMIAWIIGWDLLIEYAAGNVAVAISWSGYFQELLFNLFDYRLPEWLVTGYRGASDAVRASAPSIGGIPILINLPAVFIVLALTWLLVLGVKESTRFNTVMVLVKIVVLIFFVAMGIAYFSWDNWFPPSAPSKWEGFAPNGWSGIFTGASIVFFAYIGFDAVSTASEECKNPKRDMPFGILGSLVVCTILYMVVAAVLTGMTPWQKLGTAEPLTQALSDKGMRWASAFVAFGSVIAHTAVLLVFQMGQPRIFFSMARDGLLSKGFTAVHPKYRTPHRTTILTGIGVAVFSAFFNIGEIVDLTNIGTFFAFALVCAGVLVLRVTEPNRPRPFRTPWVWAIAPLGIVCCVGLMAYLPPKTWVRFGVWLLIGLAFYFCMVVWNEKMQEKGVSPGKARLLTGIVTLVLASGITSGSIVMGLWN